MLGNFISLKFFQRKATLKHKWNNEKWQGKISCACCSFVFPFTDYSHLYKMDNQFSYSPSATIPVNHTPATQLLSHSPTRSCLWLSVSSLWNNSLTGKLYPTSNMYIVIFPNFLGDLNSTCLSLLNDVRIPVSTIRSYWPVFSVVVDNAVLPDDIKPLTVWVVICSLVSGS